MNRHNIGIAGADLALRAKGFTPAVGCCERVPQTIATEHPIREAQADNIMRVIQRDIHVAWRLHVHFTSDVFCPTNPTLIDVLAPAITPPPPRPPKVLIVIDESVASADRALLDRIQRYFGAVASRATLVAPPIVIIGGEAVKNAYFRVSEIHAQIDRHHIDRHSYVLAIGGGALLDMVGLAAATAHRGVRLIRMPTTTLAQDDSGVGVKNGINAFGKKNFIGTFAPPYAVINDAAFLKTLSARDKRAGYVEAVKVACIRDAAFFDQIEGNAGALASFDPDAMLRLIHRCAELHLTHIATSGDPFEMGSARPLDFGHWAAHKLEQLSEYRLRHGEAVAIGIALDVLYSRLSGWLQAPQAERILSLLRRLGFDLFTTELLHRNDRGELRVLEGLEEFREHLGGALTITLLKNIGEGFEVHSMDVPRIIESITELQGRFELRAETASLPSA